MLLDGECLVLSGDKAHMSASHLGNFFSRTAKNAHENQGDEKHGFPLWTASILSRNEVCVNQPYKYI
jgi:hypothetical protein